MRPYLAIAGLLALALVPAVQADPLHLYTDLESDLRVGAQEHVTPAMLGAWVETDAEGAEVHVRLFFTHCIVESKPLGEVVCAV